ncbi:GntR family transcriptional regulator [Enemella sp. A6]|uniref:GntR family transcriptional regulator n=1 Tax=Enemella sp. A6 TaxID=3440152 RepID=UPI003EC02E43
MSTSLSNRTRDSLVTQVLSDLKARIVSGEFAPGSRLPGETSLASYYEVHRSTVRGALGVLASSGLIETKHGTGSFVLDTGAEIRAGLQELKSMSDTIREMGFEPGMTPHLSERRPATPDEQEALGLADGARVLDLRRTILADNEAVAFSYDVFPDGLFPDDVVPRLGTASVYAEMRELGCEPVRAVARVNAVDDPLVGWGDERPAKPLYLLLDQVHVDSTGRRVVWSRTYFVEGAFQFVLLRTR